MQEQSIIEQKLTLESRCKLSMTGVDAVEGFSEDHLSLTVLGSEVTIFGEDIKITMYSKDNKVLSADGKFNQIKYGNTKTPILKRIFK
jgi:hypothetical protein